MYDKFHEGEEEEVVEGDGEAEGAGPDEDGVAEVSDNLSAMHVGLSMFGGGPLKLEFDENGEKDGGEEEGDVCGGLGQAADDSKHKGDAPGMITVSQDDHPLSMGAKLGSQGGVPTRSVSAAVISSSKLQPGIGVQHKSHSQSSLHSTVCIYRTLKIRNVHCTPTQA